MVVDLRGRPDGRAAGNDWVPLLDGHRRREALEAVHQGLGHPLEELLGVGRQRLDVPALAFGVDGVECQGALAGAGGTGHDRERAVREVYGDALQVVLASVDDADDGIGHGRKYS